MLSGADGFGPLREELVKGLIASGHLTRGSEVADAFQAVPRHVFVPDVAASEAYQDVAIATRRDDRGRPVSSSSQPTIMATMLEQLDLRRGQRVLEVGAGTGYNAALIAHLVGPRGEVVTVDIDPDVVTAARSHLTTAGITVSAGASAETVTGAAGSAAGSAAPVSVVRADGALPLGSEYGRFDRVIVTAGARDLAPTWLEQLTPDGRIIVPLSLRGVQRCLALERSTRGWGSVSVRDCGFMALRGATAGPEALTELAEGCGVFLHCDRALPATPETVLEWTTQPTVDHTTEVELDPVDAVAGFGLWLAVTDPDTVRLFTTSGVDHDLARTLLPSPGGPAAVALLTNQGLGTLSFLTAGATPTARGFGPDRLQLARRLLEHLQTWRAAGHPNTEDLHVEVDPPCPSPADHPLTIDNPHNQLTISWSGTPKTPSRQSGPS